MKEMNTYIYNKVSSSASNENAVWKRAESPTAHSPGHRLSLLPFGQAQAERPASFGSARIQSLRSLNNVLRRAGRPFLLFSFLTFHFLTFSPFHLSAQRIDLSHAEPLSPYVFGHNLEHTRAAVNGGLSAQMLRNRKFAGKPSPGQGVAAHWTGIGERAFFQLEIDNRYTRHATRSRMFRQNELSAQTISNMADNQVAGLAQHDILLQEGKEYEMRLVTKVSVPVTLKVELTDRSGSQTYASTLLSLVPESGWTVSEFSMTPTQGNREGCLRYTFCERAEVTIGAASMMPAGHFHGMRRDVVDCLKAIGPRLLRWPGGNFAGEYRWKDGLLPVDQRGPLQAATEIETQPYTDGYDYHEINTDDFIDLCREVGAEPMLTINLAWDSPEESAQWVEYCNGAADTEYGRKRAERGHPEPYGVRLWSLGNEMGYTHMEGPKGPEGYADMAERHADAMRGVSPDLEFVSSGPYPNDNWAKHSAARLRDKVPNISLHGYYGPTSHTGGRLRYTTPDDIKATYEAIVQSSDKARQRAEAMRRSLDATGAEGLHISFDEWNQWYSWYRPSCVAEGIFTARMMHFFIGSSDSLDMPIVCYFQPVGEGAILIDAEKSTLTANGQVFALMKAHQDGAVCRVEDNDDYSVCATIRDDTLTVTLINAAYDSDRHFSLPVKGKVVETCLYTSSDVTPYTYFTEAALPLSATKKNIQTTLPPHSVALLKIKVR